MTKLSGRDKTVVVAVKDLEGFSDLLLGVGVLHLAGHHGQELCGGPVRQLRRLRDRGLERD